MLAGACPPNTLQATRGRGEESQAQLQSRHTCALLLAPRPASANQRRWRAGRCARHCTALASSRPAPADQARSPWHPALPSLSATHPRQQVGEAWEEQHARREAALASDSRAAARLPRRGSPLRQWRPAAGQDLRGLQVVEIRDAALPISWGAPTTPCQPTVARRWQNTHAAESQRACLGWPSAWVRALPWAQASKFAGSHGRAAQQVVLPGAGPAYASGMPRLESRS